MNKWKKVKLGELYEVHNGLSKGRQFFGSGYPFLTFSNVFNNWFLPEELESLVQSSEKERQTCSIKKGDVFITRTSETMDELGMSSVALKDYPNATYNGFTKRLRPLTDEVIPEYIGYYLRSPKFRGKFMAFSTMTTRASLANDDLLSMEVDIPEKAIQQRIATILSRYDSLIENCQKQIRLLEESAQRLYKEWFIDLRFPGHENTKIVDGVPEGWEKKKVGDIVKIKSGFAFKSKDWQKQGCPVVKIKDISGIFVNTDSLDYVSSNVALNAQHYLLNKMDLVIAMTGATIGKIGLITDDSLYANQRVGKFFLQNTIDVPYLYCFFKQTTSIEQIVQISSASSAQPNISGNQLESFKILFNVNILKEFNLKCYKYFKQMIHLYSQIRHATEARDRLLPKLMNGEIEV